jgi:hypothetical protein
LVQENILAYSGDIVDATFDVNMVSW